MIANYPHWLLNPLTMTFVSAAVIIGFIWVVDIIMHWGLGDDDEQAR